MNVSLQTIRCCSWSGDAVRSTHQVRAAACRALLAVTSHKCVRVTLAATKDCLHSLIDTLTPFVEGRKADLNFFKSFVRFRTFSILFSSVYLSMEQCNMSLRILMLV